MSLLFVGLVGSTVFVLLVWACGAVYRLYNPESPRPFIESSVEVREEEAVRGGRVLSGVREIRADRRREERQRGTEAQYEWGSSDGIPECWHRDMWHRRN